MDGEAPPRTLFEKIWSRHRVKEREDGQTLLYVDRHLMHEGAAAAYGCAESEAVIVWARQDGDPIDESSPTWTVRVGSPSGPLRTVSMATAYFAA